MLRLILTAMLTFCGGHTFAADVEPPSGPPSERGPGEPPSPNIAPAPPPSSIDPGIQKTPETVPDPKAAVPPPNIDPEMVIDPEEPRGRGDAPTKGRPAPPPLVPPTQ
jgi:hypothetical protein